MSKVLQCNCDDDLAGWAERTAKSLNMSVSTLQRVALTAFREAHEREVVNAANRNRAVEFLAAAPTPMSNLKRGER